MKFFVFCLLAAVVVLHCEARAVTDTNNEGDSSTAKPTLSFYIRPKGEPKSRFRRDLRKLRDAILEDIAFLQEYFATDGPQHDYETISGGDQKHPRERRGIYHLLRDEIEQLMKN